MSFSFTGKGGILLKQAPFGRQTRDEDAGASCGSESLVIYC